MIEPHADPGAGQPSHGQLPANAGTQLARRRFRSLIRIMAGATLLAVAASLAWLANEGVAMRWPLVASIVAGVSASMLLIGVLMGLLFFSSTSGVDDAVDDRSREEPPPR